MFVKNKKKQHGTVRLRQAPGTLLHRLLEVLHRGAAKGGGSGGGGGGSSAVGVTARVGADDCPPGVVEDLLAMMEQLGQVR